MFGSFSLYSVSGLLTAITYFPLFYLLGSRGKTTVAHIYAFHCFFVAMWGLLSSWVSIISNPDLSYLSWTIAYCFVLFIPPTLMHTILVMTRNSWRKVLIPVSYGQAAFFAIASVSGWLSPGVRPAFGFYYFIGNNLLLLSVIVWLTVVSVAHTLLILHYFFSHPDKRKQLWLLVIAVPIGFGGGTMNFLPGFGFDIYPFGNFLVPIYSLMVAYSILQHQLFDISFVLRKGIIYGVLVAIISVLYFVAILLFEPFIAKITGETAATGLLAAIVLGTFYAPMRLKIEFLVDQTIFRSYHQEIAKQNAIMQDELVRAEKSKMISSITRGLIYEIRDPLTAIKTHSILGKKKSDNKEFIEKAFDRIDHQVDRVNDLLQQLLKFSNPSALEFQNSSIHNVIEDVLDIFKGEFVERKVEVVRDFNAKENTFLKIDPVQIRQALYNIVRNAVDAVEEQGSGILTIRTRIKESGALRQEIFDSQVDTFFEIVIEDTGKGIPREDLVSIFDPFYSEEQKRAGLGLTITYRIIREHGGFIFADSEEGKGSSFTVDLPVDIKTEVKK